MPLARHQFTVVDAEGNVVPNANVVVRRELPGAPLAALKADRDGLVGKDNPCQADENGFVFFYVVGGSYSIKAYVGAPEAPAFETETWRYVPIGLNSEGDGIGLPSRRTVTEAGDVTIVADDVDEILINKAVGEATNALLPPAADRAGRKVRIVDAKGDAATNNISIPPQPGESTYGIVDNVVIIDGNGASVTLTPLPDGSGWY